MTTLQQGDQHQSMKEHARESLHALIGEQVMNALGKPSNLHKLLVCRLWKNHYRVNVFVGELAAGMTIAHSYFVKVDGDGNIIQSTPRITKRY
jgi:hypothetical protein